MARFACLFLSMFLLSGLAHAMPQDPQLKPKLKPADIRSLNTKAKKWIAAEQKWDEDPRQRKKRDKERSRFMTELEKKSKSVDILKSVGDMMGIFENAFPYKKNSTFGETKFYKSPPHHLLAPKGYKPDRKYASVLVMPGWTGKAWADPKKYILDSWKGSVAATSTFVVVPELVKGGDYATPTTEDSDKGRTDESARIRSVLSVFGEVQRTFRLDRQKMFLDCGVGTSGFGARLVTYFPSRFAGVIMRAPGELGTLQLESLAGMPVFLVSTQDTKGNCEKIKKSLDALSEGKVTIIAGEGGAPYKNATPEIDKWMKDLSRRLFPREFYIAPNHDRFHKAFWAEIIACEPLDAVKAENRPRVKVSADRDQNRIVIETRSVSEVGIYLNDYLVDLDKEVTFVVNGKEIKGSKFQRSIKTVERYMRRAYDTTVLYTAYHRLEIPKAEKKSDGDK